MYRRPETRRPKWRTPLVLVTTLLVLAAIGWFGYHFYQQNPELASFWKTANSDDEPAKPTDEELSETVQSGQKAATTKGAHIDKQLFALDLPSDWSFGTYESRPYSVYNFSAMAQASGSRTLRIYVDTIPDDQAVSRFLTVQPQGNKLAHGSVSDVCNGLMTITAGQTDTTVTYDGAKFVCNNLPKDNGTVGISSAAIAGRVRLTSLQTGLHDFRFLYSDTTPHPDYQPIYTILDSFTVK